MLHICLLYLMLFRSRAKIFVYLIPLMNDPLDMINAMGIAAARLSPSSALEISSNIKKDFSRKVSGTRMAKYTL